MDQCQNTKRVIYGALALLLAYLAIRLSLTSGELIILLNGLFVGAAAAVVVAYGRLFVYALLGRSPYDHIWQMTLGFFLLWAAIFVSVMGSILLRMYDATFIGPDVPKWVVFVLHEFTPVARFLSVVAACFQVTAPDFGLGVFHGRDRQVLVVSILTGFIVAAATIAIQKFGGS